MVVLRLEEEASSTGFDNSPATCRPISRRSIAIIVELGVHGIL
jgi:hypothetical protein